MLIMEAQELSEGQKIWNRANEEISFLSGPFKETNRANWYLVGRTQSGQIALFNLNELTMICPNEPMEDEIWVSKDGYAFIVEVTKTFVIYKKHRSDSLDDAIIMTKHNFIIRFNPS
jgi:hypothetical protein